MSARAGKGKGIRIRTLSLVAPARSRSPITVSSGFFLLEIGADETL